MGATAPSSIGGSGSKDPNRRTMEIAPLPSKAEGSSPTSIGAAASAPLTGKMLGQYRVISRLAVGGMAELWLALRPGHDGEMEKVVLKTMLPNVADSREFVRMFESEAAIGAKLRHPNLVRILDYGRLDERYFIAMEYIDGLTLRQIGQRFQELEQPFPQRTLLAMVMDVCRGLHAAHELSDRNGTLEFVHRDVSPENIMVTRGGSTKLIDFGAALTLRTPPSTARFVGKFRYVAPERIEGRAEDRRGDVYSLGVILYEYLTGSRPYEGDDLAMVSRILEGRPRPPQDLAPDLLPELARITCKALALRPDDRYSTAAALATDLLPLLEGHDLVPGKDDSHRLLRRAFDMPGGLGGDDGAGLADSDTKTVEMEVGALKEALRRTRDETTQVRRMNQRRSRATSDGRGATQPARPGIPTRATGIRPRAVPPALPPAATTAPVIPPSPPAASTSAAPPAPLPPAAPVTVSPSTPAPSPAPFKTAPSAMVATPRPTPVAVAAAAPPPVVPIAPSALIKPVVKAVPAAMVAPAPSKPAAVAPTWLFERRNRPAPATPPAAAGFFPERAPAKPAGWFDIKRAGEESPPPTESPGLHQLSALSAHQPSSPPPLLMREPSPSGDERRRPPIPEAARLFDRGLSLLSDKLYSAALEEWERACALEPENRMYQVNLKRLRERVFSRDQPEHEERP